ncbi:MAG: PEP-CTERM sorting domain-containing protein [Planctomycetota bacterium]
MKTLLFTSACLLGLSTAAQAFDLQITEIWPGNEPGENLTSDWFEVTNVGTTAYDASADGFLFFDDDSQDFTTADIISGVATIAPGESVIFIDDSDTAEFETVWANVVLPQLGTYNGSGLSQGGDGVTLFLAPITGPTALIDIIDFEIFPDAGSNGGQSYDVSLGAFSTVGNASGALASALSNDIGQFAVASVGPAVPEPSAVALAALATCGLFARRRG